MKNIYLFILLFFSTMTVYAVDIDFTKPIGFAAMNGGTTGGAGGETVRVKTYDQLVSALGGEKDATPRIIEVEGTIQYPGGSPTAVQVGSNKTLVGVGNTAFISQISLYIKNTSNIIIQNIKFSAIGSTKGSESDLITIATTSSKQCRNIWIDHCEFFNETPVRDPSASLKDKYDGLIDAKGDVQYITISWCYFHDHYKGCLFGFSEGKDRYDRKVTFHHNVFERINSRLPSLRYGTAHIYNNYFIGTQDNNGWFGSGSNIRDTATARLEGNFFKGMSNTIYSADTPLPGTWCYREEYPNMWDAHSSAPTANYEENCFVLPANYQELLHKAEDLVNILKVGTTVGVGVVGPNTVPGAEGNSKSDGVDTNTGESGRGDAGINPGESNVKQGEYFLSPVDADGYFWFNESNSTELARLNQEEIIVWTASETSPDKNSSFKPTNPGAGTDGSEATSGHKVGYIEIAAASSSEKNGGALIFALPSCSSFYLHMSRTGSFYVDTYISKDGENWTKTATGLSKANKGIQELDLTNIAASYEPIYVKVVNAANGGLRVHGAIIRLAGDPGEADNEQPVVEIISPEDGSVYNAPANVKVIANAYDEDGSISKVEFYNGNTLVQTVTSAPYEFTYTDLPVGNHSLVVRAYDDQNASASDYVNVIVNGEAIGKGESIFGENAPANDYFWFGENTDKINELLDNNTITGNIEFNTTKNDADFTDRVGALIIAKDGGEMIFNLESCSVFKLYVIRTGGYAGNILVSNDGINWSQVGTLEGSKGVKELDYSEYAVSTSGIYVKVVNTSSGGLNIYGADIRLAGEPGEVNKAPIVTILSPVDGTEYDASADVTVVANASDEDGTITKVEFYNGETLVGTITEEPYEYTYTNLPAGTHTLIVKAYDNQNATASDSVEITIRDVVGIEENYNSEQIVSTKYYNLSGIQVTTVAEGTIYVQENLYENGTVERVKLMIK